MSQALEMLRPIAPFLAGIAAAYLAYRAAGLFTVEVSTVPGKMLRRLERFAGAGRSLR